MNLSKLFETQKVLRDRINYNEPDRFNKLILALLVELGECANEQRSWKFWSKDQEPRTENGNLVIRNGVAVEQNPLLEEYVDGLHFVLELGLEIDTTPIICDLYLKADNVNAQFLFLYNTITDFSISKGRDDYYKLLELYVGLGKMLGFDNKQIEQAYYEKNEVNHLRQDSGVY